MPMRKKNKRSLQCEQGGHHWSQLSGSQVIDCRIQLWYLAHLADSKHNLKSAANRKHFFSPLFVSWLKDTEKKVGILHCPHITVWEHNFSTTALLSHPQEALLSNSNHYVMEAAAGQDWKCNWSQWAEAYTPWGAQSHTDRSAIKTTGNKTEKNIACEGPVSDLLYSLKIYWSWNLIKASCGGLSKTQRSKINLFFLAPLLHTCPSYNHFSI